MTTVNKTLHLFMFVIMLYYFVFIYVILFFFLSSIMALFTRLYLLGQLLLIGTVFKVFHKTNNKEITIK